MAGDYSIIAFNLHNGIRYERSQDHALLVCIWPSEDVTPCSNFSDTHRARQLFLPDRGTLFDDLATDKHCRLEKSRSQRVLWLLEELKVKYELKTFKRTDMLAPPELKEIHPLGKSPVVSIEIESNKAKPLVLAESASIIEYLIDHFGPHLAPKRYQAGKDGELGGEMDDWIRYRYFMHYAEGSLMPLLVISLLFNGKLTSISGEACTLLNISLSNQVSNTILHQASCPHDYGGCRIEISQSKPKNALAVSRESAGNFSGQWRVSLRCPSYRC